ncbi:response regulator [Serinibacter salmoneus]|uniref:Two-component system alkaline phosphatase synthesis response regulator PhoP n=1 Tax=Serinibacter salmoneus TaxID=556530 RepID=A0A2A9D2Q1_9MICO|nr:response regulator [Serinibacter salmoneus]PFG20934.1 two-component system alkaline phosphatase synthesis response regulator PhoP [Serinibacter salmoneus]
MSDAPPRDWRTVVVDDDPDIRHLMELAAQRAGTTVIATAEDGPGALATILEHAPDLVLLDVSLPGMSGLEVLYHLVSALGGSTAPRPRVVVVSASVGPIDRERTTAAGADAFVPKPFRVRDLASTLAGHIAAWR